MKLSKPILALCLFLAFATAYAVSQENPGQMGAQAKPNATTPPSQQKPAAPAQPPTTPTQPQTRPQPADPNAAVEKPESAVGGTNAAKPQPANLPAKNEPPNAGALQLVQPNADELRARIETALKREPSLSNASIVLNISDDAIDISGNANSPKERLTARRIVQSFAGNRRVRERINVAGIAPRPEPQKDQLGAPVPPNAQTPDQPKPDEANTNKPKTDPERHGDASDKPRF